MIFIRLHTRIQASFCFTQNVHFFRLYSPFLKRFYSNSSHLESISRSNNSYIRIDLLLNYNRKYNLEGRKKHPYRILFIVCTPLKVYKNVLQEKDAVSTSSFLCITTNFVAALEIDIFNIIIIIVRVEIFAVHKENGIIIP